MGEADRGKKRRFPSQRYPRALFSPLPSLRTTYTANEHERGKERERVRKRPLRRREVKPGASGLGWRASKVSHARKGASATEAHKSCFFPSLRERKIPIGWGRPEVINLSFEVKKSATQSKMSQVNNTRFLPTGFGFKGVDGSTRLMYNTYVMFSKPIYSKPLYYTLRDNLDVSFAINEISMYFLSQISYVSLANPIP